MQNGKGDKDRTKDKKKYRENYDQINWKKNEKNNNIINDNNKSSVRISSG